MSESERERVRLELQARLLSLQQRIISLPGKRWQHAGEELFSVVSVACFEKLDRYDWTDGRIMQIAWNRWRSHQREACRRPSHSTLEDTPEIVVNDAADARLVRSERCARLQCRLRRLRTEYRWVLKKRFIEGQSERRIAAESGRRLETVRTWLKRAVAELRRDPSLRQLVRPQ